jgi:hypothetical protein
MPSVNISKVATKAGSVSLNTDASAADARKALRDMRASLVNTDGVISSGYLSINSRKGGTVNLETRGRHEWGSFHSNKKDAAKIVGDLIKKGYGKQLNEETNQLLQGELTPYLRETGNRFGTQSFVNLIDRLDKYIPPAEPGQETVATVKNDVRLKANFVIKLKIENCAAEAKPQFGKILDSVGSKTVSSFEFMLSPVVVSKAENIKSRTQVVGDADGSMCRTVLSAINSGHMKLEESELKLLAEVMDAEATAVSNGDLKEFQEDQGIADKLDQIVDKATFKPGHHKLVFIGDILHDRFSNNKVAMEKLIRKLHTQDAVFITGNHDVYDEVNPDNDLDLPDDKLLDKHIEEEISAGKKKAAKYNYEYTTENEEHDIAQAKESFGNLKDIKSQNGFYGAKQIDKIASDKLLKDCFINAYFDSQKNALYTHNGFEYSGVKDVYLTAFGFLRAQNAEELARKMNDSDFNSPGPSLDDIGKEISGFKSEFKSQFKPQKKHGIDRRGFINKTNFRPDDSRMQTDQLGPAGQTSSGASVKVIHGHNDMHGTDGNVENLNARSNNGFSPITKVF